MPVNVRRFGKVTSDHATVTFVSAACQMAHVSMAVIGREVWAIQGNVYEPDDHSCGSETHESCLIAAQLRCTSLFLQNCVKKYIAVTLKFTHPEAAQLADDWHKAPNNGSIILPSWYTPRQEQNRRRGVLNPLAKLLRARRVTIEHGDDQNDSVRTAAELAQVVSIGLHSQRMVPLLGVALPAHIDRLPH